MHGPPRLPYAERKRPSTSLSVRHADNKDRECDHERTPDRETNIAAGGMRPRFAISSVIARLPRDWYVYQSRIHGDLGVDEVEAGYSLVAQAARSDGTE